MSRAPNFAYQSPMGDIGGSLVRAIFGDPNAAAKQAQERARAEAQAAQARENDAHASLYNSQTTQQTQQTAASPLFDAIMGRLGGHPAAPMIAPPEDPNDQAGLNASFDSTVGPQAQAQSPEQAFHENLPQMIAALAQQQGDKVNTGQTIGSLASFLGGDELARRGRVAQGGSPSASFAITPERADQIAANDAGAKRQSAFGVAEINNRDDVPVANIRAGASRYGADSRAGASRYGSDVGAAASRGVAGIKRDAAAKAADEKRRSQPRKPVSGSDYRMLKKEITSQLKGRGLITLGEDDEVLSTRLEPGVETWVRTRAIENYRSTGNPVGAVRMAIEAAQAASKAQKAARRTPQNGADK